MLGKRQDNGTTAVESEVLPAPTDLPTPTLAGVLSSGIVSMSATDWDSVPTETHAAPKEDSESIKLEEPFSEFVYQDNSLECGFYASNNRRATERVLDAMHDELLKWDNTTWDEAIAAGECKLFGCEVRSAAPDQQ